MNNKIDTLIHQAVATCRERGIKIIRNGAWAEFEGQDNSKVVGVDPIFAALLVNKKVPEAFSLQDLVRPGFIKEACLLLDVDPAWINRFYMGYDRGYQVTFLDKDGKEIGKDDVSQWGMSLAKEFKDA